MIAGGDGVDFLLSTLGCDLIAPSLGEEGPDDPWLLQHGMWNDDGRWLDDAAWHD